MNFQFPSEQVSVMKEAFLAMSFIHTQDISPLLNQLGHKLKEKELQTIIQSSDVNSDGLISYQEFMDILSRITMKEVFRELDTDGNGILSPSEIKVGMGDKLSDRQLEKAIKAVDLDGDGQINYEEFIDLFTKPLNTRRKTKSTRL
ncbi:unnamed protein product [Meganyctiphanes norvegica]|uniref:EF-hand domain-containing protein n=1 Tax=Meganyctiphanes norvegica TaxID=48144 RepID=A0AAV2SFT1_MEGNR